MSSDGFAKKSKKALKRKGSLSAQENVAERSMEDEAVVDVKGLLDAQSAPTLKAKKRKKTHQDVNEETKENVEQEHSSKKKRVKFNLEVGILSKEKSMEEQNKQSLAANENGAAEERAPNTGDTSWIQKASWKSLVGETGRVAFSLGSMLGQSEQSSNVNLLVASMEQPSSEVRSSNKLSASIDGTSSSPSLKHPIRSDGHADAARVNKTSKDFKNHKSCVSLGPYNQRHVETHEDEIGLKESAEHENAKQLDCKQALQNSCQTGVEKGCTFMRSQNYEQEWLEAKRAVKDIFKRTRKDALRSIKMFHTRHNP